jgi:general L-amino acid transport system substrate-binding protein
MAMRRFVRILVLAAAAAGLCHTAGAQTLKTVKDRGVLVCGVGQGLAGFSYPAANGDWAGFDVDFCRALAAAIFNDAARVRYVPYSASERFPALQSRAIDVLSRNSTWTMSRDTELGLSFPVTTYFDGQGFMVPRSLKTDSALDLGGASVCVQSGTTTLLNLSDFFRTNTIDHRAMVFDTFDEALKAYDAGRCKSITADISQLYALRLGLAKPDDSIILPEVISKEPLGPVVRSDDMQWFSIVRWTHFAMITAEELGVSSQTIEEALRSDKPEIRRLVGTEGDHGERLGLSKDWAERIIRLVGNYGQVFNRNIGDSSKLSIARGLNDLWTRGGIQYAPPIR